MNQIKRTTIGGLVAIFTAFLWLLPSVGVADTKEVACPDETIQEAVDDAEPGDVIEITGDCVENITISNNHITLRGVSGASITADDAGRPVIGVQGINVLIENISSISGGGGGICVNRAASARIRNNTIEDSSSSHGILLNQSAGADIFNNTISGNQRGIGLTTGGSADIDGNTIEDNDVTGISLGTNASVRLSNDSNFGGENLIQENPVGIRCNLGGALEGDPQDFGAGNPGAGDHTDDTNISADCPTAISLGF